MSRELFKKLRTQKGQKFLIVNAPPEYLKIFDKLELHLETPKSKKEMGTFDFVQFRVVLDRLSRDQFRNQKQKHANGALNRSSRV